MARISRTRYIPFGDTGIVDDFGQFGSKTVGVELKTKSLAQIQALAAWTAGFKAALRAGNRVVYMEDMNALEYVTGQMLGYILQEGIPEWEGNSTYHQNSIVKKPGTYELYASLVNDNTGNTLPVQTDDVNWKFLFPVRFSQIIGSAEDGQIAGMSASKIIGPILDAQIDGMNASKLLGDLLVSSSGVVSTPKQSLLRARFTGTGGGAVGSWVIGFWDQKDIDVQGEMDMTPGYGTTFVAKSAGKYLVHTNYQIYMLFGTTQSGMRVAIYKNGSIYTSRYQWVHLPSADGNGFQISLTDIISLAAGDSLAVWQKKDVAGSQFGDGQGESVFCVQKIS